MRGGCVLHHLRREHGLQNRELESQHGLGTGHSPGSTKLYVKKRKTHMAHTTHLPHS